MVSPFDILLVKILDNIVCRRIICNCETQAVVSQKCASRVEHTEESAVIGGVIISLFEISPRGLVTITCLAET
jgi:hypothetical protein